MKSPAPQSMVTSDSSRLMTSLGSAMMKAAQASCGRDATKVKKPSVASMSKHSDRERIYKTLEVAFWPQENSDFDLILRISWWSGLWTNTANLQCWQVTNVGWGVIFELIWLCGLCGKIILSVISDRSRLKHWHVWSNIYYVHCWDDSTIKINVSMDWWIDWMFCIICMDTSAAMNTSFHFITKHTFNYVGLLVSKSVNSVRHNQLMNKAIVYCCTYWEVGGK